MRQAIALLALALTSCGKAPVLMVDQAWVRLAVTPRAPAVAYFTVHGGPSADRLLDVTSPVVIRTELHESMKNGAMVSMKPIESGVAVPAKSTIAFQPGGKHAMLFNVNPGIVPPRTLPLVFTFASGERILVDAVVRRAGEE